MNLVKPKVEPIIQKNSLEGILKHIELCGRTCYKSQDKITEDSYIKFIERIKLNKHLSVSEHGTIYLKCIKSTVEEDIIDCVLDHYKFNQYSRVNILHIGSDLIYFVTTNYRVIIENGWEYDLKYLCEPTNYHIKRYTFKVICPISVSREWNRHRTMSISEQSTRYCNYSKKKFNSELTFCIPYWVTHYSENDKDAKAGASRIEDIWRMDLLVIEHDYMELLNKGLKSQEAREILPLSTATEVIYTAFEDDWRKFLKLRTAPDAHPEIRALANKIQDLLPKLGN
jgi:thymidylate synthase (FAD)